MTESDFPWAIEVPEELLAELGEIDPRLQEFSDEFAEAVEDRLTAAIEALESQTHLSLTALMAAVRRNTKCSEAVAAETVLEMIPWMGTLVELDLADTYVQKLDRSQLGLGSEENSRLVALHINSAMAKSSSIMASESVREFERKFHCTPEDYLAMSAAVLGVGEEFFSFD